MEAFAEASKPIYTALSANKKAIDDHSIEAAASNKQQDEAIQRLLLQHRLVQENQTKFHVGLEKLLTTLDGVDRKLDIQDQKIDRQNLNIGEAMGSIKSLANQNREQFERISALETHAVVEEKAKPILPPPHLLAGFFNNKAVQIGIIVIIIIAVYGMFQYVGVDVAGAKDLINPLNPGAN